MSAVEKPAKAWTRYTPQERDAALIASLRLGQARACHELNIPEPTLSVWINHTHKARFEELREQLAPQLEQEAVDQARRFILAAQEKEQELLEAIDVQELPAKERPGALRNIATARSLTVDKTLMPLTNRPSSYTAPAGIDELLKGLKALDPSLVNSAAVDASSVEAPALNRGEGSERAEGSSG